MIRNNHTSWCLKLASLILLSPMIAAAQNVAKPLPPTNICIDDVCNSQPAPEGHGVKWHPGHYVWMGGSLRYNSSSVAALLSQIDSICKNSNFKGIQIVPWWTSLEGATAGDYASGFKYTDQILAKLASCNKSLMIHMQERGFGGPYSSTPSLDSLAELYPRYLLTNAKYGGSGPYGVVTAPVGKTWNGLKVIARSWEAPVMDRLIALSKAYAARYDSNPNFEMISVGETALALGKETGFSYDAYVVQLKRWLSANASAWPHTQTRLVANYIPSDSQFIDLFKYCAALSTCSVGGPDPELPLPAVTRAVQANRVFRAAQGGGPDFRGTIPWVAENQALGLGAAGYPLEVPVDIFDYQYNTMRASYMIWLYNNWTGGSAQQWSSGIVPFVQSIGGKINTKCPSALDCST